MSSTPTAPRRSWAYRFACVLLLSVAPVVLTAVFGPQSGLEALVILVPWIGMLVAHACFGPLALFMAWRERRRGLLAVLAVYLAMFTGAHLVIWADASGVPEKLETEYLRRFRPADYGLLQLSRQPAPDPDQVGRLVAAGADVNRIGPMGWAPLLSFVSGSPRIVETLLEAGADPDLRSESGTAPIHLAVRQGEAEVVAMLLAYGGSPNLLDEFGRSPLCRVLAQGVRGELSPERTAMLRSLLGAGADPNRTCPAFAIAAGNRQTDALRTLLDSGHRNEHREDPKISAAIVEAARARPPDLEWLRLLLELGDDTTPALRLAVERSDEALVAVLLEGGADPNGDLYLHRTAGNPERDGLAELLLTHGADPARADADGRTPLVVAALRAHDANVRRFASLGADLDAHWRGEPLILALHSMIPRRKHIPALLVELGADVNVHGNEGQTPLMRATVNSHHELMEVLIRAGANLESVDDAGRTALHHAAVTRFEANRVVARLLDAGALIEASDAEQRTPLCLAQQAGNRSIASALEARGAEARDCGPTPRPSRFPLTRAARPR